MRIFRRQAPAADDTDTDPDAAALDPTDPDAADRDPTDPDAADPAEIPAADTLADSDEGDDDDEGDGRAAGAGADEGAADSIDGDGADGDGADSDEGGRADGGRWRGALRSAPRGLVAACAVVVVLLLVGGGFQLRAAQLRHADSVRNRALVDTSATTQVTGDVTDALNAVFSYRYDHTEATSQAARRLLTGKAARQWNRLFSVVRGRAGKQHLSVQTSVVLAGVTDLTADHATVLAFLDQTTQKGASGAKSTAAAQLRVSAQRQGDRWIISGIEAR